MLVNKNTPQQTEGNKRKELTMIHFNLTNASDVKKLASTIAEIIGTDYEFVNNAYKISDYEVDENGTLDWDDYCDADEEHMEQSTNLVNALLEKGYESSESKMFAEWENEMDTDEPFRWA